MNKLLISFRMFLIKKIAGSMSVAMNLKINGAVKFNSNNIFSQNATYYADVYDHLWNQLEVKDGVLTRKILKVFNE